MAANISTTVLTTSTASLVSQTETISTINDNLMNGSVVILYYDTR